ncbi:DUF4435 domain-containing protein [Acinetobacter ursingii]|uniref:DUF4435 domain-containing protein n=1 Tax=Acinetobacter ursingii TaxID=108980 RepID=UPI003AF9410A
MTVEQDLNDDITTYVELIKNGDDILNIVIEGKDDKLVYDEFEEIYGLSQPLVTVLPVQGRNTVLGIFRQLKDTPHLRKTIFIVDQDLWIFTGKDSIYNHDHIICTHGYSFENDVFIDGELQLDMVKKNPDSLSEKLPKLLKWYALEVARIKSGVETKKLSLDINELFNSVDKYTNPEEGEQFPNEIFTMLQTQYPQLLRGKTLLKFFVNIMNDREHCNNNTYSTIATIENVCKHKGIHLNRIFSEVDDLYKKLTA